MIQATAFGSDDAHLVEDGVEQLLFLVLFGHVPLEKIEGRKVIFFLGDLRKPVDLTQLLPLIDEAIREPVILVVDDEEEICLMVDMMFKRLGYNCTSIYRKRL